jgi:hypothetical protein
VRRADNLATVPIVLKSGSLILLEPSGSVKVCNGIIIPLPYVWLNVFSSLLKRREFTSASPVESPKTWHDGRG